MTAAMHCPSAVVKPAKSPMRKIGIYTMKSKMAHHQCR